jgi:WXG100 family type VII secretion target
MADKIRVNYPALEDMARQCQQASQRLRQTVGLANNIAQQMQNGAMQGEYGEVFVQALQVFQNKVNKLGDKLSEEASDIRQAMNDMRQADQKAGSEF